MDRAEVENKAAADLAKQMLQWGHRQARVLPDGSVAGLIDLLTTRAIVLGCTEDGWSRRFCFADRQLADQRFAELQSEDDEPQGFIARRPQIWNLP